MTSKWILVYSQINVFEMSYNVCLAKSSGINNKIHMRVWLSRSCRQFANAVQTGVCHVSWDPPVSIPHRGTLQVATKYIKLKSLLWITIAHSTLTTRRGTIQPATANSQTVNTLCPAFTSSAVLFTLQCFYVDISNEGYFHQTKRSVSEMNGTGPCAKSCKM